MRPLFFAYGSEITITNPDNCHSDIDLKQWQEKWKKKKPIVAEIEIFNGK